VGRTAPLRGLLLVVAAIAAASVAGCGVPLDESPQPITRPTLASERNTPTTVARSDGPEAGVYFLSDDRLVRVAYPVADEPTLGDALGFALSAPAEGADREVRTAIPPGTELRSVEVSNAIATIDLTDEMNDVQGQSQKEAFAQLVFTALEFDEVRGVRFRIDGKPIDAPTDQGNLSVIDADDYEPPLNPR
jgi:spore germination protein GerM